MGIDTSAENDRGIVGLGVTCASCSGCVVEYRDVENIEVFCVEIRDVVVACEAV